MFLKKRLETWIEIENNPQVFDAFMNDAATMTLPSHCEASDIMDNGDDEVATDVVKAVQNTAEMIPNSGFIQSGFEEFGFHPPIAKSQRPVRICA